LLSPGGQKPQLCASKNAELFRITRAFPFPIYMRGGSDGTSCASDPGRPPPEGSPWGPPVPDLAGQAKAGVKPVPRRSEALRQPSGPRWAKAMQPVTKANRHQGVPQGTPMGAPRWASRDPEPGHSAPDGPKRCNLLPRPIETRGCPRAPPWEPHGGHPETLSRATRPQMDQSMGSCSEGQSRPGGQSEDPHV